MDDPVEHGWIRSRLLSSQGLDPHHPQLEKQERELSKLEFSQPSSLPLVDAHLDLAENQTLFGRDLTLDVAKIRRLENRSSQQATVSLPELERGGIAVVFATLTPGFREADVGKDFEPRSAIYHTPQEAEAQALAQLALYENLNNQGCLRILKSVPDLDHHLQIWQQDRKPGLVLLMESADPILQVSDLSRWWRRGLRMIGLTFGDTVYGTGVAGGSSTFKKGGLTAKGFALLEGMAELGFIWDISHLAEEGVWQGFALNIPQVCASHANARAIIPTDRHLSDDVIRHLAQRGGVMGLVLYNGFLEPRWKQDHSLSVTLHEHLRRQADHVAGLVGWEHIGIGSDLDGGFGLEESPLEIGTVADLGKIGAVIPPEARQAVLCSNWLRFLRASLPKS